MRGERLWSASLVVAFKRYRLNFAENERIQLHVRRSKMAQSTPAQTKSTSLQKRWSHNHRANRE